MAARIDLAPEVIERMLARYAGGATLADAGREVGVSKEVVLRVLRERGVRRRTIREQSVASRALRDGDLIDRVMARCRFDPDTGCLLWQGAVRAGQPVMKHDTKSLRLRRALLAHAGREPGPGEVAWPECGRARCLLDRHQRLGTKLQHKRHLVAIGRTSRGVAHALRVAAGSRGRRKLDWPDVDDIRTRLAEGTSSGTELALEYGVSRALITAIEAYRVWRPRELYLLPSAA